MAPYSWNSENPQKSSCGVSKTLIKPLNNIYSSDNVNTVTAGRLLPFEACIFKSLEIP